MKRFSATVKAGGIYVLLDTGKWDLVLIGSCLNTPRFTSVLVNVYAYYMKVKKIPYRIIDDPSRLVRSLKKNPLPEADGNVLWLCDCPASVRKKRTTKICAGIIFEEGLTSE